MGDVVAAIDGVMATQLTSIGVYMVIAQHPSGSIVHLTLRRGSQTVTADLVPEKN